MRMETVQDFLARVQKLAVSKTFMFTRHGTTFVLYLKHTFLTSYEIFFVRETFMLKVYYMIFSCCVKQYEKFG